MIEQYDYVDVLVDNCLWDRAVVYDIMYGKQNEQVGYMVVSKKHGKRFVFSRMVKEVKDDSTTS